MHPDNIKPQVASLGLPGLHPSRSSSLVNCAGSCVRNCQKMADVCGQCGEGWHFVGDCGEERKEGSEETEIGLGRRAGWACSSLACRLAILSPADATESSLKYPPPPVVECLPGMWEAQESVPPTTKVGDPSCLITE